MDTSLIRFTEASLAATRKTWLESAAVLDIPSLDYEVLLGWAEKHIAYDGANGDSFAYGIFEDASPYALAVVEIVYTQRPRGGWLKMLSVKLGPMLAPAVVEADASKMLQVIDIYADATIGTLLLTWSHTAKVVKLYGRNESLLKLLVALNERLKALMADRMATKMEGRWLVITPH
jgi:hypothetical protein